MKFIPRNMRHRFEMLGMRQNLFLTEGEGNVWVYADCFNAAAKSVKSAIDAVKLVPVSGKKVVVLGDVAELGDLSTEIHSEIASYVLQNEWIDSVLVFGEAMIKAFSSIFVPNNITIYYCKTHSEIENYIRSMVKENDLVMFKGSHSCEFRDCIWHLWPKNYGKQNHAERDSYNEWIKMLRKS